MSQHYLVPTDGSEAAEAGVKYAIALAKRTGNALTGLYVIDIKLLEGPFLRDLSASLGTAPYVNYQNNVAMLLEERGKAALAAFQALCDEAGVTADTKIQTGVVWRCILESSELADLIVMGRSGEHSAWLEGLIGSTTETVARRAKLPVLVTGAPAPGDGGILVAYDASPHSRQALKTAAGVAESWKKKLYVLVVGGPEMDVTAAEAKTYLTGRPFEAEHVRVEAGAGAGDAIVRAAKDRDVSAIAMGAYGHSKVVELVMGSTTAHVMNHAACPVLLCR